MHTFRTEPEQGLVERWLAEMGRWNQRMNLTALPPGEWFERHAVESLRLLDAALPPDGAGVVDLGSGGGAPGLPIAIARADLAVTLVDSDRRKAAFLTHVVAVLGLGERVRVVSTRAELLGRDPAHREAYDVAVSRATAPPAALCELALPLLRIGGWLWALTGDAAGAAAASATAARLCGGGEPVAAAPGVLAVPKIAPTDPAYPRRDGVPARRPLG